MATVEQLAALVRGRVVGDGSVAIRAARPVADAGPGDITFIDDERFSRALRASPASAAIVGPHFRSVVADRGLAAIEVDDPRAAFLAVRGHFAAADRERPVGVHPMAYVATTAKIGDGVAIYPFAYVGEGSVVGDGSTLHPGAVVGDGCVLGRGVTLRPHAVLYDGVVLGDRVEVHAGSVLGADGFGYRQVDGRHVKVPHTGGLVVGDDVEIGSNVAIDRAVFEATTIGEGTKIDNLVMIAHNNSIGRHNLICGQVGLAGSCTTGDHVVLAGQAGIKDHTEIGQGAVVGAQAGVHRSVPAGQQVLGSPAIPIKQQRQIFAMIARLPEMHRQVRDLAAKFASMAGPATAGEAEEAPGA